MRRSTVILLVIFALLAGLVWYMQQPENPLSKALSAGTSTPEVSTSFLIDPVKGPVSLLSFQSLDGRTVILDKSSGTWLLTSGQEGALDQNLAEAAASQALNLRITKVLETAPDPVGTGLDNPDLKVSIILADKSTFVFQIGKETVTGSGYYVLTSDGKVLIVSKTDLDALTANFDEPPFVATAPSPYQATATVSP